MSPEKRGRVACYICIVLFMVLGFVAEIGILPFVIPAVIFLVMNISYGISCINKSK